MRNLQPERRQAIRKTPDEFAFLQVERDDGGSVLDVSEGGLKFETFDPMPDHGPVHLWFSLNMQERIEAWAEVVWINASKKKGGLRFLRLSENGREQIYEYLNRREPQPMRLTEEDFQRRQRVKEMPSLVQVAEEDAVSRFVAKARPQTEEYSQKSRSPQESSSLFQESNSLFMDAAEVEERGQLVPMGRFLSVKKRQLVLGLLLGFLISGGATVGAMKFMAYRQQNLAVRGIVSTAAPAAARQKLQLNEASAAYTPPRGNVAPGKIGPAPTNSTAETYPDLGVTRGRTPSVTPTESGGHTVSRGTDPVLGNAPARTAVSPGSGESVNHQKVQNTPQQLWDAVQAGNSNAAVSLAELYIKGEGVPHNCQQARVLLLVASEKNNSAAIKRLRELDHDPTTCP